MREEEGSRSEKESFWSSARLGQQNFIENLLISTNTRYISIIPPAKCPFVCVEGRSGDKKWGRASIANAKITSLREVSASLRSPCSLSRSEEKEARSDVLEDNKSGGGEDGWKEGNEWNMPYSVRELSCQRGLQMEVWCFSSRCPRFDALMPLIIWILQNLLLKCDPLSLPTFLSLSPLPTSLRFFSKDAYHLRIWVEPDGSHTSSGGLSLSFSWNSEQSSSTSLPACLHSDGVQIACTIYVRRRARRHRGAFHTKYGAENT